MSRTKSLEAPRAFGALLYRGFLHLWLVLHGAARAAWLGPR